MDNKETIILFRQTLAEEDEMSIAQQYFDVVENRSRCQNCLVIPRYSALPYYKELEDDLIYQNSILINSHQQHSWVANFDYYDLVKEYTPQTWTDNNFYMAPEGKYVVKGRTNSRKHKWNKCMFALSKRDAACIASDLIDDPLIGEQGILYREFIPLKVFEMGLHGLPFSNEWRFFYLGNKRLCYAYYWSIADDISKAFIDDEGIAFADQIASQVKDYVNFFVLDVAEKREGGWILIEINDASMSGLSCNRAEDLYKNLKSIIKSGL